MALPLAPLFCDLSDVDILGLFAYLLLGSYRVPDIVRLITSPAHGPTEEGDDDV